MNNVFSFFTRRKSSSKDEDGPRSPSPIPNIVVDKEKEQEMKLKQPPSTSSSDTFNCVKLTESPNEKRCSIEYLAKKYDLSKDTLANYKEAFRMFDRNNDGSVTTNELGSVMRSLGCQPTIKELRNLIKQVDEDGNGTIEFEEFVRLMVEAMQKHSEDDDLRKAFEVFDKDNDGYVSASDLKLVIRSMGERLTDVELNEMINEADKDGDGRVNFIEFQSMLKSNEDEKINAINSQNENENASEAV